MKNKGVIAILGMHRSGTSCLTGCLQDCGLYLGEVVNKAAFNIKGNKENLVIRDINDAVLAHSDADWENVPEKLIWNDEHRRLRDEVIDSYSDIELWGFKDPRTILTLPFWLEALPELKMIGTFRHPVAVAASLNFRDGRTYESGYALWFQYNYKLIDYSEKFNFPIVCFDQSSDEYIPTVMSAAQKIGIKIDNKTGSIPFFEESLRHQNMNDVDIMPPEDAMSLYNQLCSKIALK